MSTNYISQIREILSSRAYTQSSLADRLGVTFAALNRWLNGHAKPHPRRLETIAKLYRQIIGFPSLSDHELAAINRKAKALRRRDLWNLIAGREDLQKELLVEHTYNSTSIEGTTLTQKETEVVILGKGLIPDKSLQEHLEVTNHATVLRNVLQKNFREPLTEALVKDMHRSLLQGVREDAGSYSKYPRVIRGLDIELTHPKDIPEELGHLLRAWNRSSLKTVREIAEFHAQFELIHPFGDGNGRIGRLILALQCLERGYPPAVIENARKAEYYEVLEYAQKNSEGPFTVFLVEEMERTAKIIRRYV
jgi:Fic family protein/DNA-binding XRE family transcriptional regulator